jgi:uncharacterized membrane protein
MAPSFALFQSIAGAAVALVVIVVVGWFAVARIRRWMRDDSTTEAAFTLEDLRRLRREGQLTEEEFETARAAMIGAVRKAAQPDGAEVKRRVSAGIRAAQTRAAPPTTPGTLPPVAEGHSPPATEPRIVIRPEAPPPIAPTAPESVQDGTHTSRSPKRPPQLG